MATSAAPDDREPKSTAVIYLIGTVVAGTFCLLTAYMCVGAFFGPAEITEEMFETRVIEDQALTAVDILEDASFRFRSDEADPEAWQATAAETAAEDPDALVQEMMQLVDDGEVEIHVQRIALLTFGQILTELVLFLAVVAALGGLSVRLGRDCLALWGSGRFRDGSTVAGHPVGTP